MVLEVPKTRIRLQPYIKVYASKGGYDGTAGVESFIDSPVDLIGAVQKVDIRIDRDINFWRELNKDTYGAIQETYPSLPTYELTLTRFALYESNLAEAFGFVGIDLLEQTKPLVISLQLFSPVTNATVRTYNFNGCWFQNQPFSFDVMSADLKVIQESTVTSSGVTVSQ